ncbi:unnamed protein product [Pleuronectes platessa]|uniref:Uncharacterized protein n=1 Tax=Pleuronectes platessa TaxID=8262 RepID=A0A9N7YIV2_PLEPL|nr:unnamed protein product [Pleuronectes platessa]
MSSLLDNQSHPRQENIAALGSSFSDRLICPGCLKESQWVIGAWKPGLVFMIQHQRNKGVTRLKKMNKGTKRPKRAENEQRTTIIHKFTPGHSNRHLCEPLAPLGQQRGGSLAHWDITVLFNLLTSTHHCTVVLGWVLLPGSRERESPPSADGDRSVYLGQFGPLGIGFQQESLTRTSLATEKFKPPYPQCTVITEKASHYALVESNCGKS